MEQNMAVLMTPPKVQFLDDNGDPLSGGKVYAYSAGTSTPKDTYTDAGAGTPNANPVILDSAGRADIWLSGSYKIVLKTSADVTISTTDNITSFNASTTTTFLDTAFILQDDGDTSKQAKFDVSAVSSATTATYTLPNASTTLASTTTTQTFTNKTLTSPVITTPTMNVLDSDFTIQDNSDATKQAQFQLSGITTGTTRTYTLPNATGTLADLDTAQTMTNKTLSTGCVLPVKTMRRISHQTYTTSASLATTIPGDDTVPQITEGVQIMTDSLSARTTTARWIIVIDGCGANSAAANNNAMALFVAGGTNAVRTCCTVQQGANEVLGFHMSYEFVPGTTSATALEVRAGASAGTFRMNGNSAGRFYGGTMACTMSVWEVEE
jgi:hypothetical protein